LPLLAYPQLDSREFQLWAQQIAAGNFRWPPLPSHGPGYPFLLGALFALGHGSLSFVRVVQSVLGGCTAAGVAVLTARLFGRRAGLAAGILTSLYGPLAFVDVSLLAEGTQILFLTLALLWFTMRRTGWTVASGFALGLSAIIRATALPLIPALAVVMVVDRSWPRRWRDAVFFCLASLSLIVPVVVSERQAIGAWLPIQGVGSFSVYLGNRPGGGVASARLGGEWDLLEGGPVRAGATNAAEMDHYYLALAKQAVSADPGGFLRTVGRKVILMTQADEVRDSHSYQYFESQSIFLRWLPGWGLVLALAAAGFWVCLRRRQLPIAVLVYLGLIGALCLAVVVGIRYRLPLVPALAVFAGAGVAFLIEALSRREWRAATAPAAVALVVLGLSHLGTHAPSHDFSEEWALSAGGLMGNGDEAGAERALQHAFAANPRSALAWGELAQLRLRQERWAEAETAARRAEGLYPNYQAPHRELGLIARHQGDVALAVNELSRAVYLRPDDRPALAALGDAFLAQNKLADADRVYRQLLAAAPDDPQVLFALARLAGARGHATDGVRFASRAAELEPDKPEIWVVLADLALDAGDAATANRALGSAQSLLGSDSPPVAIGWAMLDRVEGRLSQADARCREVLRRNPGFSPAARLLLAVAAAEGTTADAQAFLHSLGSS
jgi:tetratricopeptide (TPR) repeat protein